MVLKICQYLRFGYGILFLTTFNHKTSLIKFISTSNSGNPAFENETESEMSLGWL